MELEALARDVRLLILDVDGVLTDGGLYYDSQGQVTKRFHVQDGLGIKLAQAAGVQVAVITGLDSTAVERRVRELGIEEYFAGHRLKVPVVEDILARKGLEPRQAAYMGDDWVDAGPMRLVGLPLAVANAQPEIKALARWVSGQRGGHGAVREAINFILGCQGVMDKLWRDWSE